MILALLDPRAWLVALVLMASSYGMGRWQQWQASEKSKVAYTLSVMKEAQAREAHWQQKVEANNERHQVEITRMATARDAAVRGLRERPARLSEAALAAGRCDGATGKQLSRDDAEFLAGFAFDRDAEAAKLRACQAWVKAVTADQP